MAGRKIAITPRLVAVCLLLLSLSWVVTATNTDTASLGEGCVSDSDCSPPYIACTTSICRHKTLFPMTGAEVRSLVTLVAFLMVSIIVSIAGGVVIVPVVSYWMGFSAKQAVAMSNTIVLMTSLVKYMMGLWKNNPLVPYRTIVDYNAALLLVPPLALFSSVGGIIATFLPDLLILFLLLGLMVYAVVSGYYNLQRQLNKERSEQKVNQGEPMRELLVTSKKDPAVSEPAIVLSSEQKETINLQEIEAQQHIESSNFVWKKFSIILAVLVLAILVAILRGGRGSPSLVGISQCSSGDWIVFLLYIGAVGYFWYKSHMVIFEEQQLKNRIGWVRDSAEVHLTHEEYTFGVIWTSMTGVLTTIAGLGGGILLNPLLMRFQFMPVTAVWTINLTTVIAKIAAVIIHVMAGDLLYDYVFFYGGLIVLGIIISENTILEIVKRTKSQLFYPAAFLIVISICSLFAFYVGIDKWVQNNKQGRNGWEFQSYC